MTSGEVHVVTGAFGYSGRYIAQRLLDAGLQVRTLTNSPNRSNPFGPRVQVYPFHFDDPPKLTEALGGASVLYNTYWIRFNKAGFCFETALQNTRRLFEAAKAAEVERVVHVSITNPSEDSPLGYFRGKAKVERILIESGLSYAILRPAILFGKEDILINNIAWTLRKMPVFGVFGDGSYRLRPIYVDDLAKLAIECGAGRENSIIDAVGPETFTYRELVEVIGRIIGKARPVISVPLFVGYAMSVFVGKVLGDVVTTREEIKGLMAGLLCTDSPPTGQTRLTDWVAQNADRLGCRYTSELARRRDRTRSYDQP